MNYGEMKTQFSGLLKRRDCTSDLVETFMQQGLTLVQRELRVPAMEKTVLLTVDSYDGIEIPGDLLELKHMHANEITLRRADLNYVLKAETASGIPQWFARDGVKWRLGPAPEANCELVITYWGELSELAEDTDTNELSGIAPDLFVYAALKYAADYFVDKRAGNFAAAYEAIKGQLQAQADADELSGGASVVPAYSFPCDD